MFKIVVAGCGQMSDTWIETIMKRSDCRIAAFVDIDINAARTKAIRHGLHIPSFTDLAEAITAADANLFINTAVPEAHAELDILAMQMGCDVFSEKPMALTARELTQITDTAAQTGRSCFVMQNRRFLKGIRAYRDVIASGKIGRLALLNSDFFIGINFGGFRLQMEDPLVMDMAIHTFDMARYITNADATRVYCRQLHIPGSPYVHAATAVCTFDMSDGSVFSYRGSWESPGAKTSWQSRWHALGSTGAALWDGEAEIFCQTALNTDPQYIYEDFTATKVVPDWPGEEQHAGCINEMFDALINHRPALTDSADNRKSMDMVLAAIESSRTGQAVDISSGWA